MKTRVDAVDTGVFLLVAVCSAFGETSLRVNEVATRMELRGDRHVVLLPIENPGIKSVPVSVTLDLVDPDNQIRASASKSVKLKSGRNTLILPLDLKSREQLPTNREELLWYRLRYRVADNSRPEANPAQGVLAIGQITPDAFELHAVGNPIALAGETYVLRVRAVHPVTRAPIPGVRLESHLGDDDEDEPMPAWKKVRSVTNARGYATLSFRLPPDVFEVDDSEIDWEITGRHGVFQSSISGTANTYHASTLLLFTDKPIYQPGQKLRVRLLAMNPARRPLPGASFRVELEDPEDTSVFRTNVTTSKFGVAFTEWDIPESLRLGDYRLSVGLDGSGWDSVRTARTVRISRYDLPNFSVSVKPDRAFYVAGEDANIEVRANYLFSKPILRGKVRVVKESQREWDYKKQKWIVQEEEKYEGELNSDGTFSTKIPLQEHHSAFAGETYRRFRDLSYTAYVTDPSTQRTEQRLFSLRLTQEKIHVYVIEGPRAVEGMPLEFYVSTFHADGTPAQCSVEVRALLNQYDEKNQTKKTLSGPLTTIKTNRYGVAHVRSLNLSSLQDQTPGELELRAWDQQGNSGHQAHDLWWNSQATLRITTNKALYAPREPVEVQLEGNFSGVPVVVEALVHDAPVASQMARLRDGRAFLVFSPHEGFRGEVQFAAYALGLPQSDNWENTTAVASRTVLFPALRELSIGLKPAKQEYRPGEKAMVQVSVQSPEGGSNQSSFGVVVFDRAVEERAQTDGVSNDWSNPDFRSVVERVLGYDSQIAGIRRPDLNRLDMAQPLPEGMDLVAEILLLQAQDFWVREEQSDFEHPETVFSRFMEKTRASILKVLDARYSAGHEFPKDENELVRYLADAGVDFSQLRDPWETSLYVTGSYQGETHLLTVMSAGPDKKAGNDDDFGILRVQRKWFSKTEELFRKATALYHQRTGEFLRDAPTLMQELASFGLDANALQDPWGNQLRMEFGIDRTYFTIMLRSPGPDHVFSSAKESWRMGDDVNLLYLQQDYAERIRAKVDAAFSEYFAASRQIPDSPEEAARAFAASGLSQEFLSDPWGRPYHIVFSTENLYGDHVVMQAYDEGGKRSTQGESKAVTEKMRWIHLRSVGPDGVENTPDDFSVATFSRLLIERTGSVEMQPPAILSLGGAGAIIGVVTDATGAVIPKATVTALDQALDRRFETTTNDEGSYVLRNLPTGFYRVRIVAIGFKTLEVSAVPVRASAVTQLNGRLEVGAVSSAVMVESSVNGMETTASAVSAVKMNGLPLAKLAPGAALSLPRMEIATPRLREYFPETLLWLPDVQTDPAGKAKFEVQFADNITTWKMAVIGSNLAGQIGVAEKEIQVFQPFFVEHDPPKVLTEGDEISLPVVLRNYLEKPISLQVEMKDENWFSPLDQPQRHTTVPTGDYSREIFAFRANASIKSGKQRIVAAGRDSGDAIEKSVSVHPDGEERVTTTSNILRESGSLHLHLPAEVLPGAFETQVKIYPNLSAHVVESIEGILQRPYGCGEQTISSTYPNLLFLRYLRQSGKNSPLARRAERFLREGYKRLLNYRTEDGGFAYWTKDSADYALTAYAVRFLSDAQSFIEVDDEVLTEALHFLILKNEDGRWVWYNWRKEQDDNRSLLLTAYIARIFAAAPPQVHDAKTRAALESALTYLSDRVWVWNEPYLLASYALAAQSAGKPEQADQAVEKLRNLAREENGANYWVLESNTPFYGWGLAGRIETTALVVQALAASRKSTSDSDLVTRGLLFLLRNKDRYGVWYSTQATINVLDALLLLDKQEGREVKGTSAEVVVNGKLAAKVTLPEDGDLSGPLYADVSKAVSAGDNKIDLSGLGSSPASVQVVSTYYVPWRRESGAAALNSDVVRLEVSYDRLQASSGDRILCHVSAERAGHKGYGMMVAEIGLPPGADVDRASLAKAVDDSQWSIRHFDALPDRVIFYLWPRAGAIHLSFVFRVRYGLRAKAAPSLLYDYYNPEARTVVQPPRFVIQ